MSSVGVIGGGITGLTAAFRLRQAGVPVALYEAGDRTGGVVQSSRQGGYLAECGPNTLLETSPKITALVRDAGLDPPRLDSDPRAKHRYLVRGRRTIRLPGSPLAFFASPLFSWRAKLSLLREPFVARSPAELDEDLAAFVIRRLCREFLDYAINPLVGGVYAGDPARLSVRHAFPKLLQVEQRYGSLIRGQILGARERRRRGEISKQDAPKLSFQEGLQELPDALARALQDAVRLNTAVVAVRQEDAGWALTIRHAQGQAVARHDAILVAVPTYRMPPFALRQPLDPPLTALEAVRYPPVSSVVLGFRREDVAHPLDGFGVLVPEIERFAILGTIFSSALFPNRAPEGHVALTSYLGGTRAPELALRPTAELVDLTVKDLAVLLGVRGRPTFVHHVLYPQAIPQYEVGYGRFKTLLDRAEAQAPGLFFAGHYRNGISLGDSILSGHAIAERIAAFWPQRRASAAASAAPRGSNLDAAPA